MRRRDLLTGLLATTTASAMRTAAGLSMPAVNDETNAVASAISPAPSSDWLQQVDILITTLKQRGIWATLDLFYCFAAPSESACSYNWVNTATGRLTANGTISYNANNCLAGDGSTGWFSTNFQVNNGKGSDGNSAFGHFCLNECTSDDVSPFQCSGDKFFIGHKANGSVISNIIAGLNTSDGISLSSVYGSTVGHWTVQQNDTTAQIQVFLDGSSIGIGTATHSAGAGTVQILKSGHGHFTSRQVAFVHYGSKLTAQQQLDFSKALYSFLTAMDVRPKIGGLGLSTGPTNVAPYKHLPTGNGNSLVYPVTTSTSALHGSLQGRAGAYPYCLIKVNDPNYLNLYRFEVHKGDAAPFDGPSVDRIQFNTAQLLIPWQVTGDISFAFFIEPGSTFDCTFCGLPNLHDQTGGVNSGPTHALYPRNGNYGVWVHINPTTWSSPYVSCATGRWHFVRTTFRMDNSPNGFVQTWLDGNQLWNRSGVQVGTQARAPFWWNLALYRGNDLNGLPLAVWYANIEIDASGSQPFASRINNPLPVPPLT
jgi:hypothetical protein